jgi:hypothetical protein
MSDPLNPPICIFQAPLSLWLPRRKLTFMVALEVTGGK